MRAIVFVLIWVSIASCELQEKKEIETINTSVECQLDTFAISNYLSDLVLVLRRNDDYSSKPFMAYRRLEALSGKAFDIDYSTLLKFRQG